MKIILSMHQFDLAPDVTNKKGRESAKIMFKTIFSLRFKDHPTLNDRYLLLHLLGRGGFSEVFKVNMWVMIQQSCVNSIQSDSCATVLSILIDVVCFSFAGF